MKNYTTYQRYQQSKYPKHVGANKRDANDNIIYYESLSYYGFVIRHYQEYDNLNRRISYKDTEGNSSIYTYFRDTNTVIHEEEIYIDKGIKSLRISNYNRYGCIIDKTVISGNIRFYQNYENNIQNTFYSPFERIV